MLAMRNVVLASSFMIAALLLSGADRPASTKRGKVVNGLERLLYITNKSQTGS